MDIVRLNKRVLFQKSILVIDEIGNRRNEWANWYSCMATISEESGDEERDAGQKNYTDTLSVTVRYCRRTSAVTPSEYRLLIGDTPYDISSVEHYSYKNKMLKFRCRRMSR